MKTLTKKVPLCTHCGKEEAEHLSVKKSCPIGKKHRVLGHMQFSQVTKFEAGNKFKTVKVLEPFIL